MDELPQRYAVPRVDDIYVSPTEPMAHGSFMLTTRWRKGEPMLSLGTPDGQVTFDTIVQPGSPSAPARTRRRPCTPAPGRRPTTRASTPGGKIAVVERSDAVTPAGTGRRGRRAGALALVVVNDGVGGLNEYAASRIPVASVHRDAGAGLVALAKRGAKLTAKQVAVHRRTSTT